MSFEALSSRLRDSELQIAMTGGSSWLGQATLGLLERVFGDALSRRVAVFGSKDATIELASGRQIASRALSRMTELPTAPWLLLHYAFLPKEAASSMPLSEYVRLNQAIGETVEAAARRLAIQGIFVPSSGAVYRSDRSLRRTLEEHPYGFLKVGEEARFQSLSMSLGCRLAAMRVFNIAGPCMNKISAYALGSIILDALNGRPVTLRARNMVYRSYVHIDDLIEMALLALLDGRWQNTEFFDTAGEVALEVGELARFVLDTMGLPGYEICRPPVDTAAIDRYVGLREPFATHAAALGTSLRPLEVQVKDTVSDLKKRPARSI